MSVDETIETDVLIIGSGPIGAIYARILSPDRKVMMVDAGPQMSTPPGRHLRNHRVYQHNWNNFADVVDGNLHRLSVPSRDDYQEGLDKTAYWKRNNGAYDFHNPQQDPRKNLTYAAGAYAVGGMSTLWTCATPRAHPTMERSTLLHVSEWDKLYKHAEFYFQTATDQFDGLRHNAVKGALTRHYETLGRDYKFAPDDSGGYGVKNLPMAAVRRGKGDFGQEDGYVHWIGVDDILGPLLSDAEQSKKFTLHPEYLVTKLVDEKDTGEITHAVVQDFQRLKTVHIKAGTFIVATGPICGPQLLWNSGIRHDALGRYLNDQIVASCLVVLGKDIVDGFKDSQWPEPGLPPDAIEPQVWIPVSEKRPWHSQIHQDPINFTTPGGDLVDQRLLVFMQWFGMTEPLPDNRVIFTDKYHDTMGMPMPTFEYTVPDEAAKQAHDMIGDLAEASLAVGGWLPGQLPQFEPPGASLHFQSTTRMGKEDDGKSVVDTNSLHWGYTNLYVGGCGVIPNKIACNPTLTAAALAVRSAYHIAGVQIPAQAPHRETAGAPVAG